MAGGASPAKTALALAQKFTYSPPSAAAATVTKRARDLSTTTTLTATKHSESKENGNVGDTSTTAATSSSSVSLAASDDEVGALAPSKKRKLEIEETVTAPTVASSSAGTNLPADIVQAVSKFQESLSNKSFPGLGGALSERELLQLEVETMHPSWLNALHRELRKPQFLKLKRFLWSEGVKSSQEASKTIFPPARDIYSWSRFTPLENVRVVILGQDPYHNDGQAHGLCFSVRSNVKTPPSLKNIYKEIKNDFPQFVEPKHGYLASWARQGVLLLNTSMTVKAHLANSHSKKGWEEFTDSILRVIDARPGPGVVFLAWGQPAQKRINATLSQQQLTGKSKVGKHLILSSVHPSPLSASRGFFGNSHFKKCNEWLVKSYGDENAAIDWCTLNPESVEESKGLEDIATLPKKAAEENVKV